MRRLKIPKFISDKIGRILVFFALGWVATIIIVLVWRGPFFGAGQSFFQDVFTAWCGELVFFTMIGLAATVISIEKPEDPRGLGFDERVDILFGHQRIPQAVLEHNREGLKLNARYSSDGWRKITITDYKAEYNAYLVRVENRYSLKSAIADFDWTEKIDMAIKPDPVPGLESDEVGKIISIKINGDEKIVGEPTLITKEGFATVFEETSSAGKAVEITANYEIYMVCGCHQTQRARRFAESITLEIVNQRKEVVTISFADKPDRLTKLLFNQPYKLPRAGVEPGGVIVSFKLHPPRGGEVSGASETAGTSAAPVLETLPSTITRGSA